ncbi:MAG: ABC transporter substrate-binding protein [Caenispirillum sp.]|nr:ABC transporter substrate-binding protein [Caenispirillum sp.]
MFLKRIILGAGAIAAAVSANLAPAAAAETAICYNCPPEWADWGGQLANIERDLGITVPPDNKNSGQTLSQLLAEQASPVADVAYYGVSFGIKAAEEAVVEPYKPAGFDRIADGLKDPDGKWFAIHAGTIGLMVNTAALGDTPVPTSWSDLLKPEYAGKVGYLDPSSAFVGYASAVAINQALGGSLDDFGPAIDYFKKLKANDPIVPKQTSYARVLSGEIPILFDYDFNAYRARHKDGAPIAFVIPAEGTLTVPYVMSLVKNAPHADNGRRILDYVLSDAGQAHWAGAFLRPVMADAMSAEAKEKFLPESEYARAGTVDYGLMAEAQKPFQDRYLNEVR